MRKDLSKFKLVILPLVFLFLIVSAGSCSPNPPMPVAAIGTSVATETPLPPPRVRRTVHAPTPTDTFTQTPIITSTMLPPTTAPEAVTPATPLVGIEMHKINSADGLDLVASSGAYWIRRNAIYWSDVEPLEGQRNWANVASLEQELQNASQQGLQVILIVRSAPYWAQKSPGVYCGAINEDKLPAFASFMHDLVSRYSAPPYNVKYYELGNEPDVDPSLVPPDNIFGCWGDAQDPDYGGGYYAEMLKAVYPQIKAADPDAQVLTGGLLLGCDPRNPPESPAGSGKYKDCSSSLFLEGILKNGGGDYFDGVSFHAYDYSLGTKIGYGNLDWYSASYTTGPVVAAKADYLRSLLTDYGFPDKKLFNTETGLLCSGNNVDCNSDVFNTTKAYYVAQSNASARAENLEANIWYSLQGWRFSGLVDDRMTPLPVYNALVVSADQLNQAVFTAKIDQFNGVMGYEFNRPGERLWVVWSLDGEDHLVSLPSVPDSITGVFGEDLPQAAQVSVTQEPLYIAWATP